MGGCFIALEGLDGSGTTSCARALAERLTARGHTVVTTAQPSDRSIGRAIRGFLREGSERLDPRALALLFAADRLDHLAGVIEPALAGGAVVICDRYVASSWAYQALSCDLAWVKTINAHARWPDLTAVLTVDPELAAARVQARAQTTAAPREIFDALALQRRVAAGYAALVAEGRDDVVSIDAAAPLPAVIAALEQACSARGL